MEPLEQSEKHSFMFGLYPQQLPVVKGIESHLYDVVQVEGKTLVAIY